jgi:hypothetical protein
MKKRRQAHEEKEAGALTSTCCRSIESIVETSWLYRSCIETAKSS